VGINAIYLLLPVIAGIRDLEPELGDDPFLGHGKITVSDMVVKTPSINAVPDEAVIYIDRRMTFGETKEEAIAQVEALIPEESKDRVKVEACSMMCLLIQVSFSRWTSISPPGLSRKSMSWCRQGSKPAA
jgi:acetylornithine deacetylase/succinyl-diaminopimelate desuccinylase-like protein